MTFHVSANDRKVMAAVLKKVTTEGSASIEDLANKTLNELFKRDYMLIDWRTYHDMEIMANTNGPAD